MVSARNSNFQIISNSGLTPANLLYLHLIFHTSNTEQQENNTFACKPDKANCKYPIF